MNRRPLFPTQIPYVEKFVEESNKIEGIFKVSPAEIVAHINLLKLQKLELRDIEEFVDAVQPGAILRDKQYCDVRVGSHYPPRGGPNICIYCINILNAANNNEETIFKTHLRYEALHPFTDGNGRSGRALWLWRMQDVGRLDAALQLGFLHNWYYQSLQYHDSETMKEFGGVR